MPIYEFLCRDCGSRFEDLVGINDVTAQACTSCDSKEVVKLYSPFAVHGKAGASQPVSVGGDGGCVTGPSSGGGGCCGGGCGGCG